MIEIDEAQPHLAQVIRKARDVQQVLDVTPMAGALADDDLARTGLHEGRGRAGDDEWMRVDRRAGRVLDQIRLEQHRFAADVHPEFAQAAEDDVGEVDVVARRGHQRHGGTRGQVRVAPGAAATGREERPGGRQRDGLQHVPARRQTVVREGI